jgi:hypothetical protein
VIGARLATAGFAHFQHEAAYVPFDRSAIFRFKHRASR